ncbi:MAG: WbqC family protein [Reichenbachiella sp.]
MKIAIMQPYIFPYVGYFQLIASVDKFICLDDVNFIKKGWINRNQILINDQAAMFSIPLQKISQNRSINDHFIIEDDSWKNNLLKTLTSAYKKAPQFESVYPIIAQLILQDEKNISKFNYICLKSICELLNLETQIIPTSSVYEKKGLKSQGRILDICTQENASHYYNLSGGQGLYDKKSFDERNIELHFLDIYERIKYAQFKNEFISNLSIIDLLMFNSLTEIQNMILNYSHE